MANSGIGLGTKIALETVGCKLNQAETELLAEQLAEAGCRLVDAPGEADVYILNTCTVTHVADSKSRHLLRAVHERNPGARLIVTGCYAERAPRLLAQIEGVDLVLGNREKLHLPHWLTENGYLGGPVCVHGQGSSRYTGLRTRAFIKIQDGCRSFCAYCIVPRVRSSEESVPVDRVVAEIERRIADGYKEVVLTGTKIGSYEYGGVELKELIERILAGTGVTRLRLSSLQPQEISAELVGLWRDKRLCRHFHLSLQSGSDRVLQRMRRRYSVGDYQAAVSLIRSLVPEAAITTDVIVGFPGETEVEFGESYELCRQMQFARIHVFPYSLRQETEAARLPQKVSAQVKKERSRQMLALAGESVRNFSRRFFGEAMPVLWEKQSEGIWSGLTDNYIKVYTRSDEELSNQLLPAKLVDIWGDGMWGLKDE
jgi:threonylcarbamoyladenosine tRNA methylthiotransferase MtaB